jgi:hypothetical protein
MVENLINLILKNPNDIHIQYSNINGKEELFINGKEVVIESEEDENPKFDDSEIKTEISNFKEVLQNLDDSMFLTFCEELGEMIDINDLNKLMDQDSFTKDEAEKVEGYLCESITLLCELIEEQLNHLNEIREMLLK